MLREDQIKQVENHVVNQLNIIFNAVSDTAQFIKIINNFIVNDGQIPIQRQIFALTVEAHQLIVNGLTELISLFCDPKYNVSIFLKINRQLVIQEIAQVQRSIRNTILIYLANASTNTIGALNKTLKDTKEEKEILKGKCVELKEKSDKQLTLNKDLIDIVSNKNRVTLPNYFQPINNNNTSSAFFQTSTVNSNQNTPMSLPGNQVVASDILFNEHEIEACKRTIALLNTWYTKNSYHHFSFLAASTAATNEQRDTYYLLGLVKTLISFLESFIDKSQKLNMNIQLGIQHSFLYNGSISLFVKDKKGVCEVVKQISTIIKFFAMRENAPCKLFNIDAANMDCLNKYIQDLSENLNNPSLNYTQISTLTYFIN